MDGIKRAGIVLLRVMGILAVLGLLIGGFYWLQPDGEVLPLRTIFIGTGDDADCIVLLNRDKCVVIDTGEEQDAERILEVLREQAVTKIDCMILTHPDKDHIGGAPALLDELEVELVVAPYYVQNDERYELLQEKISGMGIQFLTPSRNREFYYGDIRLRIFPPDNIMYDKDNDYSLITMAEHGDIRMLFMGDAEKKRIQETRIYGFHDIDLYKVPHHGRDSKTGAELIATLRPGMAVVTAQAAESEIENALRQAGTRVCYTVPWNDLVFESDGKNLTLVPAEPVSKTETAGGL